MAFFTTMRAEVPLLPPDLDGQDNQFTLDERDDDDEDNDSGSDCEITDDVIRRRLQILENLMEKDENGAASTFGEGLENTESGNLPGDVSKNSTLKHSDFAELPLSSPPLTPCLPPPPPMANNSNTSSSSRSSITPTKGVTPPVTVTVNGQVQDFSASPPDFPPPPPPPDYSDEFSATNMVDYNYKTGRTKQKNVQKCDLYLGDDDGHNTGNSSTCSTPTPTSSSGIDNIECPTKAEPQQQDRFDYEIDPDIGVIV